jgi:non-specific serine/threonine protein kinase
VDLERRPLELLSLLLTHAGEVVTKEEILEAIWPGREVTEASLTKCVARLRQAVGDTEHDIIRTVHGYGYRFAAPVAVEATAPAPAPPPATAGFAPGNDVPHRPGWRLVRRLGTGGYGDAWLVEQEKSGARKMFKFAADGAGLAALRREVSLSRLLREALGERADLNRILDWQFDDPPAFIETAWFEPGNLAEWATTEGGAARVPLPVRLELAARIADALAAIHALAVLHKDLKPANILIRLDANGHPAPVLTDFGSGRALDPAVLDAFGITRPEPDGTREDSTAGTAMYRAPELSAGGAPTVQADIFALGVILFQLVAGDLRRPLAPGWEDQVADPLLRDDIGAAAAGDPARRLADATVIARRLRTLAARREAAAAAAAREQAAAATRRALELARARRAPLLALVGVLLLASATSLFLLLRAQRAERSAEAEAARATTVTKFLTDDLLSAANPLLASDPNIPVKKLLGAAAADLDRRFAPGDEDRAALETAIGGAYAGLADQAHAMPLLRAALATLRVQRGDTDPRTEAVRGAIADLAERTADLDTLRATGNDILGTAPTDPETLWRGRFAVRFADCMSGENDAVCVEKLRPFLADATRALGRTHPLTLRIQDLLAYQLAESQQFGEAIPLARQTVALTAQAYGPDHLLVQDRRLHLGEVLNEAGQTDEAIAILADVHRRVLAMSGTETDMTARVATQYARALTAAHRTDEALPLLRGALAHYVAAHGENFELARMGDNLLAKTLAEAGRPREAIPLADKAFSLQRQARGADNEDALWIEANLAEDYRLAGDLPKAEEIFRDIVTRSRGAFSHGEWDLGHFEYLLANVLVQQGKSAEARPLLTESVAVLTRGLGADNARTKRASAALAALK